METWRSRAKAHMKSRRITQEKLAEMLGVTQGAVGHWLSGRREPGIDIVMAIAACIDMPFAEMTAGLVLHDDRQKNAKTSDSELTPPMRADFVLTDKMDYVVPNNPSGLTAELQSRIVPPHIETAIMALLQTCEKREAKPTQNSQMFSVEEQRKNIEALRQKLTPEQLRDFDGWLESLRSNNVGGLPSSSVYIAGADPKPAALPKGRTA